MSERTLVGLNPALPWPLGASAWWTEPVRAERLAALRIGLGAVLLADVLLILPDVALFIGSDSLAGPDIPSQTRFLPSWMWSGLSQVTTATGWTVILLAWALAALCLMLGVWPRRAALVAWFLAGSVHYANPFIFNGGDNVRNILLFYLMVAPCGAVWALTPSRTEGAGPVHVPAWPLRLLFVQLVCIYFVNGVAKYGPQWRSGEALHYVMGNIAWTRVSWLDAPVPGWAAKGLTWLTLVWELTFPLAVLWPRSRVAALWLGVLFHIGTGVLLKLAMFPFYMICCYLPLLPWERWCRPAGSAS